ncbi:hypothetical protein SXCC_02991 [Gluconacetobacter sp. SXCC-1]|nr:hypothetical protein SXCC_02991 [Gluconacetobacter sp. SXCC-1]
MAAIRKPNNETIWFSMNRKLYRLHKAVKLGFRAKWSEHVTNE